MATEEKALLAKVREVREWVDTINHQWVDRRRLPDMYCAYDREAGLMTASERYEMAQGNLRTFVEHILLKEWKGYDVVVTARGESVGIHVEMLEHYELELGLSTIMVAHQSAARPKELSEESEARTRWERLFSLYANQTLARPSYLTRRTDWTVMTEQEWKAIENRVTRIATCQCPQN